MRSFPGRPAGDAEVDHSGILHPQGNSGSHRIFAVPLQRNPPTWKPRIPVAGPGDGRLAKLAARLWSAAPATQRGRQTRNALTFDLDQSTGAGQWIGSRIRG